MFDSWIKLGIESNLVIGLRLMCGGRTAQREANLMVAEKLDAAMEANGRLLSGQSSDKVIQMYRRRVAANVKRLSGTCWAGKDSQAKTTLSNGDSATVLTNFPLKRFRHQTSRSAS